MKWRPLKDGEMGLFFRKNLFIMTMYGKVHKPNEN